MLLDNSIRPSPKLNATLGILPVGEPPHWGNGRPARSVEKKRFDTLGQTGCDKTAACPKWIVTVEGRIRPHIAICAYREQA